MINISAIEFAVDEVMVQAAGVRVSGMMTSGDLHVGSIFGIAYRPVMDETVGREYIMVGRTDVRNIAVRVSEIRAYDHQLDELPCGMSAQLLLIGEGAVAIRPRDVLACATPTSGSAIL